MGGFLGNGLAESFHFLFESGQTPFPLGQLGHDGGNPQKGGVGHGGDAADVSARRDILANPGFGANSAPVSEMDMSGNAHLAGEDDPVAQGRGACYSHLSDEHTPFPHLDIVAELHQIIDFCPCTNAGLPKGSPVYCGIGANLDVVVHYHPSDLGEFDGTGVGGRKTEAIAAEHGASMDDDPVP
jgi:hypothetical protein